MRIGVTTFGCDGGRSGIGRYIISLLGELPSLAPEDEFEVVCYEDERDIFVPDGSRMATLTIPGWLRPPVVNIAWHQTALPALCRRRKHDALFLPAGNRRLPLRAGLPTAGTVHDLAVVHVKHKYSVPHCFYARRVLPVLMRRLTTVLTDSESSARDIVEFAGVPEERVIVAPLAADTTQFRPRDRQEARERVAERYGVRPPFILYLARIEHPGKNHVRLIRAFERVKTRTGAPHQLVFVGGDWTRSDIVHRVAAESNWAREIVFAGFVRYEDVPWFYNGADLFVFPSLSEGFGLPVLEAMCSETPVACSNVSSVPEVAGDAAVLFDPTDTEGIAEAMERLLLDNALRESCVRKGLARSRLFSWRRTAEITLEALRDAARQG